eukprot:15924-Chlamydomonas_euryale.AAC.1
MENEEGVSQGTGMGPRRACPRGREWAPGGRVPGTGIGPQGGCPRGREWAWGHCVRSDQSARALEHNQHSGSINGSSGGVLCLLSRHVCAARTPAHAVHSSRPSPLLLVRRRASVLSCLQPLAEVREALALLASTPEPSTPNAPDAPAGDALQQLLHVWQGRWPDDSGCSFGGHGCGPTDTCCCSGGGGGGGSATMFSALPPPSLLRVLHTRLLVLRALPATGAAAAALTSSGADPDAPGGRGNAGSPADSAASAALARSQAVAAARVAVRCGHLDTAEALLLPALNAAGYGVGAAVPGGAGAGGRGAGAASAEDLLPLLLAAAELHVAQVRRRLGPPCLARPGPGCDSIPRSASTLQSASISGSGIL